MEQDINLLAMAKGAERYIFLYDDANRTETLRMLGRFAADPELAFTWFDAAVLSQKVRQCTSQLAEQLLAEPTAEEACEPSGLSVERPRFSLPTTDE
jgi:hypothetical protein